MSFFVFLIYCEIIILNFCGSNDMLKENLLIMLRIILTDFSSINIFAKNVLS